MFSSFLVNLRLPGLCSRFGGDIGFGILIMKASGFGG